MIQFLNSLFFYFWNRVISLAVPKRVVFGVFMYRFRWCLLFMWLAFIVLKCEFNSIFLSTNAQKTDLRTVWSQIYEPRGTGLATFRAALPCCIWWCNKWMRQNKNKPGLRCYKWCWDDFVQHTMATTSLCVMRLVKNKILLYFFFRFYLLTSLIT